MMRSMRLMQKETYLVMSKKEKNMNNLQLQTLANRCPILKEIFIGVFPSDCIPDIESM